MSVLFRPAFWHTRYRCGRDVTTWARSLHRLVVVDDFPLGTTKLLNRIGAAFAINFHTNDQIFIFDTGSCFVRLNDGKLSDWLKGVYGNPRLKPGSVGVWSRIWNTGDPVNRPPSTWIEWAYSVAGSFAQNIRTTRTDRIQGLTICHLEVSC